MKLAKCKKLLASALAVSLVLAPMGGLSVKAEEMGVQTVEVENVGAEESNAAAEEPEGQKVEDLGSADENADTGDKTAEEGAGQECSEAENSEETVETEAGADESTGEVTGAMSEENAPEETEITLLKTEKANGLLEGQGTAEDPYQIETAEELTFVAEKVNGGDDLYSKAHYKLSANINLNGSEGNQWTPIGTSKNKFTGTFIGTDFEITGLYIDNKELNGAGLFGVIASPAKLEGITVNGAKVIGKSQVGAIAGSAYTGSVVDCKVIGKIEISGNYKVGGMFGEGYASITNSSVTAETGSTVTGVHLTTDLEGDNVGGLIGFRGEGDTKTVGCTVSGVTVAGTRKVGGLIGSAYVENTVDQCSVSGVSLACNAPYDYAKGAAKNQLCVGGLIGIFMFIKESTVGTVTNCSISDVDFSVTDDQVRNENWAILGLISGGYRASSFSGASAPDGKVTVTDVTVSGNNTGSNAEEKFPGSIAMNGEQKLFANGTGTAEDPYMISSVEELKKFVNTVNKTGITYKDQYVKVADNLTFDLSDGMQIGSGMFGTQFEGTFDGNGVVLNNLAKSFFNGTKGAIVKNITVNAPTAALFESVNNSVIQNITLRDVKISGTDKNGTSALIKGPIFGSATIDGIEVTGTISGTDYVGGIVGGRAAMEDGDVITIKNCINRATITATKKCGGIVGYTNSSKGSWVIENCKNYADITSDFWAGGISGGTTRAKVSSCVNEGNIKGVGATGGIIAIANSGTTVTGCSNKGSVNCELYTGGDKPVGSAGGIIGSSSSGGNKVSKSANTGNIKGVTSAAGIIGGTASAGDAIDNCYNGGTVNATGEKAIAAGIYGYNNSTNPVKACINDGNVTAPNNGTVYPIGLSNYWYGEATGSKIATCYYIEDGKIYAVAEDGKSGPIEQTDMTRTELAETLNKVVGEANFWQPQNGSVQPDPIIPGAFDDMEKRVALILDKDGNVIEGYTSLESAIEAVKDGQTVVLEKDVTLEKTLVIKGNREVTLDLNGKTLTLKDGVKAPVLEVGDKAAGTDRTNLTLTDKQEAKGGVKSSANSAPICVRAGASMTTKNINISFEDKDESAANAVIQVQGTLTVEEGTKIDSTEYGITVVGENASLIVNGGKINAKESAVSGNGTVGGTEIVINAGELHSTESAGIYHPQNGKLTLNGGTITGLTGVQMCAGNLEIPKDSKVEVTATGEDGRTDKDAGDGPIADGAAISIVNRDYPGGAPKVSISGGKFVAEKSNHTVLAYEWDADAEAGKHHSEWEEAGDQVAVSGGTYNKPIAEELLEDGFALNEPDKDGNYGVHKHDMTKVDKKDATCTETGISKTYYKCDVCGKCFEDEAGEIEITKVDSLIIPAKGHHYVDGKCTVCGAVSGSKPEEKPDSKPEEKPEEKPDSKPDSKPEEKPDNKPDKKPEKNEPEYVETIHPQSQQSPQAVDTGDSANVALWISVLIIAAGAAIGGMIYTKRRKKK